MSVHSSDDLAAKLKAAFQPESLEVIDESHLHAGHHHGDSAHHAGFDGSGGTHFRLRIVAERFRSLGRIERHRAVNTVLRDELATGVHALAIEATAPGEPTRRR